MLVPLFISSFDRDKTARYSPKDAAMKKETWIGNKFPVFLNNWLVAFTVKATIFVELFKYFIIDLAFSIDIFLGDFSKKTNPT